MMTSKDEAALRTSIYIDIATGALDADRSIPLEAWGAACAAILKPAFAPALPAPAPAEPTEDVEVTYHGTICRLVPLTEFAREWISDNVQTEGWQWLGMGLAVEPRCLDQLLAGMQGDGLVVEVR